MAHDAAHTRWWEIGEVVFGVPFLAALGLQWLVPLAFPRGSFTLLYVIAGIVPIIGGITLIVLARQALGRQGQPTDPGQPTSAVVTTGIFAVSRNPIYLGAACVLLGIALAGNLPWVIVLLAPSLYACHKVLIMPEERYLAARFGADYRVYTAAVCRWLGRS